MQPSVDTDVPCWRDVRAACDGLQQAMDAMIGQPGFESFRPGIARAIALARDEKQRAGRPEPLPATSTSDDAAGRLEAIAAGLAPPGLARAVPGADA